MEPSGELSQLRLREAIEGLYAAFARYPLRPLIDYCSHCQTAEQEALLHAKPLREMTEAEFGGYPGSAIYTFGTLDDYKHFLPRLLELDALGSGTRYDLWYAARHLVYGRWREWPRDEQDAIERFAVALCGYSFAQQLAEFRAEKDKPLLGSWLDDLKFLDEIYGWPWPDTMLPALARFVCDAADVLAKRLDDTNSRRRTAYDADPVAGWMRAGNRVAWLEGAFFADPSAAEADSFSAAVDALDRLQALAEGRA